MTAERPQQDGFRRYARASSGRPNDRAGREALWLRYARADRLGTQPPVIADTILAAVRTCRPKPRYATRLYAKAIADSTMLPDRLLDAGDGR